MLNSALSNMLPCRITVRRIAYPFVKLYCTSNSSIITDHEIPRIERKDENIVQQKARLLYQSRKRGMLENGLLLSTFADKYLSSLTPELTNQYDELINGPSNDWDIYYWLVGRHSPPKEFDNEILTMLKEHTQNRRYEQRFRQPDLRV